MTSYIAYDNINADPNRQFSAGSTSPTVDYPIANLQDYSTYTLAKFGLATDPNTYFTAVFKSTMVIDYIGIMGHNLPLGTTIEVATNAGAVHETLTVEHAGPLLLLLATPYSSDGLKLTFAGPGLSEVTISVLMYGEVTALPEGMTEGFTPPPMGRESTSYPATSGTGQYLAGHLERVGWGFKISQRNVVPAWMDANWLPMVFHVERSPFFFSWDHEAKPEDAMYAWVAKRVTPPSYQNPLYLTWSLNCRGLHIE